MGSPHPLVMLAGHGCDFYRWWWPITSRNIHVQKNALGPLIRPQVHTPSCTRRRPSIALMSSATPRPYIHCKDLIELYNDDYECFGGSGDCDRRCSAPRGSVAPPAAALCSRHTWARGSNLEKHRRRQTRLSSRRWPTRRGGLLRPPLQQSGVRFGGSYGVRQ